MYRYEDIQRVHLEMTTRCNASCPQCPRNLSGGRVNPRLELTELSLADVQTIFPPDVVRQLRLMYMCGSFGDAMVARDTLEVFEYFREHNPAMQLRMHTNASGRTPAWWKRLARVVSRTTFSVDGLKDTNHIYRRGTDWRLIRRAMDSYLEAGGKAEWAFLIFRHNEHQVEEARALAKQLGFVKFTAKRTYRFLYRGLLSDSMQVLDRHGKPDYLIEMPQTPEYRNEETLIGLEQVLKKHGTYDDYLGKTEIDCKAAGQRQIYVSASGLVLPCCWMGSDVHLPILREVQDMLDALPGGRESIDARRRPIREIVDGPLFQDSIPKGWKPGVAGKGRLAVCSRVCGSLKVTKAQFAGVAAAKA